MHMQIGIFEINRNLDAFAAKCRKQRLGDIEVQSVAELVQLTRTRRFNSGGEIPRIVPAEARFPERSQQILQRPEAKEVERLVGHFEPDLPILAFAARLRRDIAL